MDVDDYMKRVRRDSNKHVQEFRKGVLEAVKKVPTSVREDWLLPRKAGVKCIKLGNRKPTCKIMADESTRSALEHACHVQAIATKYDNLITDNVYQVVTPTNVDENTVKAVLWLMKRNATGPQRKLFS